MLHNTCLNLLIYIILITNPTLLVSRFYSTYCTSQFVNPVTSSICPTPKLIKKTIFFCTKYYTFVMWNTVMK